MRNLRENLPNRVCHLISRVALLIAPVGKDSPSSSRRAYKLTRKGKEVAYW